MKIIIEKIDIERFIKEKYPNATFISGLDNDIEILIRLPEIKQESVVTTKKPEVNPPLPKPANTMNRSRSNFPKF